MRFGAAILLLLCVFQTFGAAPAGAHALEPGYLELRRLGATDWDVLWRRPDVRGRPMAFDARLPDGCTPREGPAPTFGGRAWNARWVASCPQGLAGGEIAIPGLEATATDVLVRYETEAGTIATHRLTADSPAFVVPKAPGAFEVISSYFWLGVEHILEGIDHLLFVFALLLLIRGAKRLVWAITAFTAAHTLTLAASTLGWAQLPGPPVEATIALSIMFLASELAKSRAGAPRLSERSPWLVAFAFGLLHGFGFAGALREIGLPEGEVPLALLSFNIGVEAGQLAFVACVLAVGWIVARAGPALRGALAPGRLGQTAASYAIGGVAALWFIERVASF